MVSAGSAKGTRGHLNPCSSMVGGDFSPQGTFGSAEEFWLSQLCG